MLGQEMIGEVIASTDVGEININTETQSIIGDKRYYGNNHLGNNSVTFTDRKIPESDGQGGIDYSLANITYFAALLPRQKRIEHFVVTKFYENQRVIY